MHPKKHPSPVKESRETYLLKIYRRGKKPPNTLVGTIEEIAGSKKGVFKTERDLVKWLKGERSKVKGEG
jgi:hypothetical protein